MSLLQTDNLTKDYGQFRALDHLNLTLEAGEVFGLLGPNGSGKTTSLRLIMGFLQPTLGSARIQGHDCWAEGVQARQHVTYLPGELRLYDNMTGRQLIRFLCELRDQSHPENLASMAQRFDIDIDQPLSQMSSGMKRKVALLQVLVLHAKLIIMDEPTNTLDPRMRDELLYQVEQAKSQGQTVLFSSHVLSEVEQVCDRVGILRQGKLVHVQQMSELRDGRRIQVHLQNPIESIPEMEGLTIRQQSSQELTLEHTGSLPELFTWLGQQALSDLRMEPLGLAPVYYRYHGALE